MSEATCGVREAQCRCDLPPHDETVPHECGDRESCNGSWLIDADGRFHIVRIPGVSALALQRSRDGGEA